MPTTDEHAVPVLVCCCSIGVVALVHSEALLSSNIRPHSQEQLHSLALLSHGAYHNQFAVPKRQGARQAPGRHRGVLLRLAICQNSVGCRQQTHPRLESSPASWINCYFATGCITGHRHRSEEEVLCSEQEVLPSKAAPDPPSTGGPEVRRGLEGQ